MAQATLGAERGMTMLELAERLGNAGFTWLVEDCAERGRRDRPLDDASVRDRLAQFETEITGLRGLCRRLVERHEAGTAGPADASIVKLLLQRAAAADDGLRRRDRPGLAAHTVLAKPMSSGWESGAWVLDFIGSWEWTIPGGAERDPAHDHRRARARPAARAGRRCMNADFTDFHDELRAVARESLARPARWWREGCRLARSTGVSWRRRVGSDSRCPRRSTEPARPSPRSRWCLHEMGRAVAQSSYLGSAVLGVGALKLVESSPERDDLLRRLSSGGARVAVALPTGEEALTPLAAPFSLCREAGRLTLHGRVDFVPDAGESDGLLLLAQAPGIGPVLVCLRAGSPGLEVSEQPVVDVTRRFASVAANSVAVSDSDVWRFAAASPEPARHLVDRGALATACDSLGLAEAVMEATVAYAGVRQQFGRAIGSFQAVKHGCADMLVQITVCRELVATAVHALVSAPDDAWVAASQAKSYVGEAAVEIAGKAMQLHGGIGYTWDSGIHFYLKRAALNRSLFGSPRAHRRRLGARFG